MKRVNGQALRCERLANELDVNGMAEVARLSNNTVYKLERGNGTPQSFFKLCDALQVNPVDFVKE